MQKPIYLVITELFPTSDSFRGPYVYDQVRAIEKDGRYEVVVLRPTSWLHKEKNYEYNGIKVYRFTHYDLPSDMWPGSNTWLSLRAMDKCLKYLGIAYNDIAVVHAHVSNNASITGMMCWGCHWVGSARRNGTGREHYVME